MIPDLEPDNWMGMWTHNREVLLKEIAAVEGQIPWLHGGLLLGAQAHLMAAKHRYLAELYVIFEQSEKECQHKTFGGPVGGGGRL